MAKGEGRTVRTREQNKYAFLGVSELGILEKLKKGTGSEQQRPGERSPR